MTTTPDARGAAYPGRASGAVQPARIRRHALRAHHGHGAAIRPPLPSE